jgi:hypothetical protein
MSKDVRIRGYFSESKGIREHKLLRNIAADLQANGTE